MNFSNLWQNFVEKERRCLHKNKNKIEHRDHDYHRQCALESIKQTYALLQFSSKQSLAFNQKVCHDNKLNDATHKFKREIKQAGRRTTTIGSTHALKTIQWNRDFGKKEKDAGRRAHSNKRSMEKSTTTANQIKIIIIRCEHLRFTYHYLLGWFSIVFEWVVHFGVIVALRSTDVSLYIYISVSLSLSSVMLLCHRWFGSRLLIKCHCMLVCLHKLPTKSRIII